MSLQQVTCLTLLDLSAAFDTILLERQSSWFGITLNAQSWIKSYLLDRSFFVNIESSKSSSYQLLHGVPQGSVPSPLIFIIAYILLHLQVMSSMLTILNSIYHSRLLTYHIAHLEQTASND